MATDPRLQPAGTSPKEDLKKEANERLVDARAQKRKFDLDIREAYFFAAPQRSRQLSSEGTPPETRPADAADLQTSIAFEESENFATTLISSFMPQGMKWVDLKPAVTVEDQYRDEVQEAADHQRDKVFELIDQSNFYAELAPAMNPDAAVGTFAIWIDNGRMLHEPVVCHPIPLRELEVNVGPNGEIDDRFVVRHTKNRFVKALIPAEATLPDSMEQEIKAKPNAPQTIHWGFWRKWDRQDDVVWQHVVMVKQEVVFSAELVGEGSCPVCVAPFNRHPEYAYGEGPLIKCLPELRHLDDMAAAETENVDLTLRPPMAYPDDSFANVENGVETGGWYPIRPGTEGSIKKMYEPNRLDAAYFDQQMREKRVRKLFYNDFPEQRGDTPPTATQWVDEMAMAQRKIGTPGLKFWVEGPRQFFLRFYFIAKQRGLIEDVQLPNTNRAVSLAPYNPTQRAQNQQKVAMAMRAGQIGASLFPEEFRLKVDGGKTLLNIIKLMDVEDVFEIRSQQDIQQAAQQLQQLSGVGNARFPEAPQQ